MSEGLIVYFGSGSRAIYSIAEVQRNTSREFTPIDDSYSVHRHLRKCLTGMKEAACAAQQRTFMRCGVVLCKTFRKG